MAFEIVSTGRAIPPNKVTNDDLAKIMDTNDEWIRSHTGIGARHWVAEGVACSDLALEAAENAVTMLSEKSGETPESIKSGLDIIILATTTPDYLSVPSTACVIQGKLGARNAAAFDITAACAGLIYGIEVAAGLCATGKSRKRALVIGSEILSHIADMTDRGTAVLFGDGASAVILEKTAAPHEGAGKRGLIHSILGADGTGADSLCIPYGGTKEPLKVGEVLEKRPFVKMDGRAVYNFAVKAITDTIENLLAAENITINDVRWIVPHQANARIVSAAQKRIGIPNEKIYLNIEEYANTGAASVGIALDEMNRAGKLQKGDVVIMVAFGAGLAYAGALLVW